MYLLHSCKILERRCLKVFKEFIVNPFQKQSIVVFKHNLNFEGLFQRGGGGRAWSNSLQTRTIVVQDLKLLCLDVGFEYTDFFSIPVNMAIFLYLYWSVQNDTEK